MAEPIISESREDTSYVNDLDNPLTDLYHDRGSLGPVGVKPLSDFLPSEMHYTIEKVRWIEGKIIHDISSKKGHEQVVIENNGKLRSRVYELKSGGSLVAKGAHPNFLSPVMTTWTTDITDDKGTLIGYLKLRSGAWDTAHVVDIVDSLGNVCAHTIFPKNRPEKIIFRFPDTDEEVFRFTPYQVGSSVRWNLDVKRNDLVDPRVLKILAALVSQNITLDKPLTFKSQSAVKSVAKDAVKWAIFSVIALAILNQLFS